MAKTLGAITLPDEIEWVDRYKWIPVRQSAEYTLGGTLVVEAAAVSNGRSITLVADPEVCWVPKAIVDALLALAATPGATHVLDWEGEIHTVMFALHNDAQAVSFDPLWPHDEIDYTGSIKLVTV